MEQQADEEIDSVVLEYILSLTWESGTLSASYYIPQTMEVNVMQEVIDLRPNFSLLHNLFRQLSPVTVLASGHEGFLKQVMQILNIPEHTDPTIFHVMKSSGVNNQKFLIYPRGEKMLHLNRRRILQMKLSGIPEMNDSRRQMYLDSILPLKQSLVVHSLGNLIDYLETNRKILFKFDSTKNLISNLKVTSMDFQVQIDDTTFEALKIFSANQHPSAFKQEVRVRNREGFSLFGLLNKCNSKIGALELKMIMQQPLNDMAELNSRYDAIEWFQRLENHSTCFKFQRFIRKIIDIRVTFKKILETPKKLVYWRSFQKSITNGFRVLQVIQGAVEAQENVGVLKKSSEKVRNSKNIELIIQSLETILDLKEEDNHKMFIIRKGVDQDLDNQKNILYDLETNIPEFLDDEVKIFVNAHTNLTYGITFIPEMGFVLSVTIFDDVRCPFQGSSDAFTLVLCSNNTFYFNCSYCQSLNEEFGNLFNNIQERENKICDNLLKFIDTVMVDLQSLIALCAQIDYLMGFAVVSSENNYVRPELFEEKVLEITEGRHVLLEVKYEFVANDVLVDTAKLVGLLTAPNSTGKSVFLKQIGSIAYMAHIGCFVPAKAAKIGVLDAIYSRIYSPESLHQEVSSFLADVQQMGKIMMNSTDRSLVLIDEFGKGSNVDEGKAILVACVEDLLDRGEATPITFLTTHYVDIYDLMEESHKKKIINYTIPTETNEEGVLSSTFKICLGRCPNRYAFNHREVRKTLDSSAKVNNSTFCTLNNSSLDFMNELSKAKITFAFNVVQDYLRSERQVNMEKIFQMFDEMAVKVDASSSENSSMTVCSRIVEAEDDEEGGD